MSKQSDYVQQVYETARAMGMPDPVARLAAAQSAVETQYGTRLVGNNYFGIKAGSSWTGPSVAAGTKEETGGTLVSTRAKFRAYPSFEASLADWYQTIGRRWPEVLQARTVEEAAAALKAGKPGGYATDSQYASKLLTINNRYAPDSAAPVPATPSPALMAQRQNPALDAIKQVTAMDPTSLFSGYMNGAPKLTTQPVAPAYAPPAPWAALAAQASPAPSTTATRQYPSSVTLNLPVPELLSQVRAAEPGLVGAATFFAKDKDAALTGLITDKLPSYMRFDPASNAITFNNLNQPQVQADLAGGVKSGFPKIDAVFAPYLAAAQKGMTTPVPLPREARPATSPPNFPASYNPTKTLAVTQGTSPAIAPPASPWETPLPASARALLAKPYSVSTQTLAPNQAMTPTGAVIAADAMRALSDPNYKPPVAVSQKAETPLPAAASRPVAPPPVFTWTTSSRLAAPPVTPTTRPGTAPAAATGAKPGLFGINPMQMLSGFLASAARPAPRGQFGQPLAVGGTYRDGAVYAANGMGYGGSPGQSTAGLKPGERVYDTNTGEWGLKVGQPVTWTSSTGNRVDGSSAGSAPAGATGTFKGTSTGNSYTVGNLYSNGNGTYRAMPDGTFKRV